MCSFRVVTAAPRAASQSASSWLTRPVDATELAETLDLLRDWAAGDILSASLRGFLETGNSTDNLRDDLARFIFLLRGDDGEAPFTRDQA
jgi:hypothetical protein